MYMSIGFYEFREAFRLMGRENQFSYEGLYALYNELLSYEEMEGVEMELDVIAICCDYSEWENLKEFQDNYGDEYETMEDVENRFMVISIDDDRFITSN